MSYLCRSPVTPPNLPGIVVGCGQCGPCRAKRQMTWVHRIMLESLDHSDNSFWSLSYRDEDLSFVPGTEKVAVFPNGEKMRVGTPTLNRRDYILFLKRLREKFPRKLRFFIVGEYGETKWRPHYHLILFGYPKCANGQTRRSSDTKRPVPDDCCEWCKLISETWTHGNVFGGDLTPASARYCAHYTLKRMTMKDDGRLKGRHPEFAQFSRRPGIGVNAMFDVASSLMAHQLDTMVDVPLNLRHGSALMPLGRTLRGKLRVMIGKEDKTPETVLENMAAELSLVRQAAFNDSVSFKETVKSFGDQEYQNWEAKRQLKLQRKEKL